MQINEKSKVVFTKSGSKFRVVKRPLPVDKEQLMEWAQQEFQAVTSFSEFRNGNTIDFHARVGKFLFNNLAASIMVGLKY